MFEKYNEIKGMNKFNIYKITVDVTTNLIKSGML